MSRIRVAIGNCGSLYQLEVMPEYDEGYLTAKVREMNKKIPKRGRGSQKKTSVSVKAEPTPIENSKTGKPSSHCQFFIKRALPAHESKEIEQTIKETIGKQCVVFCDKRTNSVTVSDYVDEHLIKNSIEETRRKPLSRWYVGVNSTRQILFGRNHELNRKYLQLNLSEICCNLSGKYVGKHPAGILAVARPANYCYN